MRWIGNELISRCWKPAIANRCVRIRIAPWELRVDNLRVYYDVAEMPEPTVFIRAVGINYRNRVVVGGEEIEL